MESTTSLASDLTTQAHNHPLTDRLLAHLPGPRLPWIAAWALLPAMHYMVLMPLVRISGHTAYTGPLWGLITAALPSHVVQAYMIILTFWASRKLTADALALRPTISHLCPAHRNSSSYPFVGMSSLRGPLAFTTVVTAAEIADTAVRYGLVPAFLFLPYQALWILPMMTLPWVYIAFLVGLDRLGQKPMNLGSFPEDLSLGLGPVGTTVFDAFLIFCAMVVPFLLASLRDWLDLTIGLAFFGAGVGAFFLSVWRLHRQMIETKRTHVSRAAALYAAAYEPLRNAITPAVLQACSGQLNAAQSLLQRAHAIQEWPFDDRTLTRIVAISTGVATAVIARAILGAVGL